MNFKLLALDTFPLRSYVQIAFFAGDIREFARRCGNLELTLLQDSLDQHYSIFFQLDNVPFEVMAYLPCLTQEFTVYADKEEADIAPALFTAFLAQIEYGPEEVGRPWESPLHSASSAN